MANQTKITLLRLMLLFNGALLALAIFAVAIPNHWMDQVHVWLGLDDMPEGPMFEYLARSLSAFYAVHGLFSLYLAFSLKKNWHLVPLLALAHLFLAIVFLFTDLHAGMPWWWTWLEGPPISMFCLVLLYLWKTSKLPDEQNSSSRV